MTRRTDDIPYADDFSWSEPLARRVRTKLAVIEAELNGIYSECESELIDSELQAERRIIGESYSMLYSHLGLPLRDQFASIREDWG